MTYRLPSLNGVRAFEAAARHLSFKHAAIELCVTAGAVSQQVKALENSLGITLFNRLPSGLLLTNEGETYLVSISDAFDIISSATDKISNSHKSRKFRLGVAPTLGEDFYNKIEQLQNLEKYGVLASVSEANNLDLLAKGSLDALLRPRIKSHPRLHLDQLEFVTSIGDTKFVTLAMMPGNAGCREHQILLNALSLCLT